MADLVAKVGYCRWVVSLLVENGRLDLPTLTHSPQLPRYAMPMTQVGGRATSDASRRRFLGDGGRNKLIPGASWTTQWKSAALQDALEVREPHLDLLALAS
jgi:hypothetical protein